MSVYDPLGILEKKTEKTSFGLRKDGSKKGQGFLGVLKRPGGGISTELSIGVNFDGKEREIPTLVPTLTKDEVYYLLSGNKPTKAIIDKAVAHARSRLAKNKSPFKSDTEVKAKKPLKVYDPLGILEEVTPTPTEQSLTEFSKLSPSIKPTPKTSLGKQAKENLKKTLLQHAGVGEAIIALGTGVTAAAGGLGAGLTAEAWTAINKLLKRAGYENLDPAEAFTVVKEAIEESAYQPRTELGRQLLTPSEMPQPGDYSANALLRMADPRRLISAPYEIGKEMFNLPAESWNLPETLRQPGEEIAGFAAYAPLGEGFRGTKNLVRDIIAERKARVKPKFEEFKGKEVKIDQELPQTSEAKELAGIKEIEIPSEKASEVYDPLGILEESAEATKIGRKVSKKESLWKSINEEISRTPKNKFGFKHLRKKITDIFPELKGSKVAEGEQRIEIVSGKKAPQTSMDEAGNIIVNLDTLKEGTDIVDIVLGDKATDDVRFNYALLHELEHKIDLLNKRFLPTEGQIHVSKLADNYLQEVKQGSSEIKPYLEEVLAKYQDLKPKEKGVEVEATKEAEKKAKEEEAKAKEKFNELVALFPNKYLRAEYEMAERLNKYISDIEKGIGTTAKEKAMLQEGKTVEGSSINKGIARVIQDRHKKGTIPEIIEEDLYEFGDSVRDLETGELRPILGGDNPRTFHIESLKEKIDTKLNEIEEAKQRTTDKQTVEPEKSKIDLEAEEKKTTLKEPKDQAIREILEDKKISEKEGISLAEKTKDIIKKKRKSEEIPIDAPIRFTNIAEVNHMLRTGRNFLGKDAEGNLGISASVIPEEFGIVAYGKKTRQPVAIIYPKEAIEGTGVQPNEVMINPATKLEDLKFIIGGQDKLYTLKELKALQPKPIKKEQAVKGTGLDAEVDEYLLKLKSRSTPEVLQSSDSFKEGLKKLLKLPEEQFEQAWKNLDSEQKEVLKREYYAGDIAPDVPTEPPVSSKDPVDLPVYSDPELAQTKATAQDLWDAATQKFASLKSTQGLVKSTIADLKEYIAHPEDLLRKNLPAKNIFKLLINVDENINAFLYRNLKAFYEAIGSIERDSISSTRIGKVLDGQAKVDTLTKQERRAYDFMKENYDFLIHEFARRACGSEEAYQRIVREVGKKHPKRVKVADLKGEKLTEYKALSAEAAKLRGKRKVSELSEEERHIYDSIQQEKRDILKDDFISSLSSGEREAYLVLSRRIDQYLPHLFDRKELLELFKRDLKDTKKKLAKATKKGSITRYKNRINELTAAITKLEGGGFVSFRQLPKNVFFAFFNKRKGAKGYSFDAIRAYETYVHGLARKMFAEPALKHISTELFPNVDPSLKPYVQDLVNHYMGYERRPFEKLANFITTAQWIRTLGLNPRSALTNLTQRLNTVADVGEKWAYRAEKMMLAERAKANDLFEKTGISREVPAVLTEGPPSASLKTVNNIARYMFNQVELGNRKHAFLAGYLKGKHLGEKKGLSGEALEAFATKEGVKTVHRTQFRYGKLGMPKIYWNPAARIVLQFTSYPLKQARFLYKLFKRDKVAFLKYVAYAEAAKYTLQELLKMDMSNALGFGITWGEALNVALALGRGDSRAALRHLRQSINLGGGLLPSGVGPTASGVMHIAAKATESKGLEQTRKELTPIMWTRISQALRAMEDATDGEYPIYNSEGHRMYTLTKRGVIQRTFGPRTTTELKRSQKYKARKNLELERTEVTKAMIKAFIDKDRETFRKLYTKYKIIPTSKQIENELLKRRFTPEELRRPGKRELYQLMREGRIY